MEGWDGNVLWLKINEEHVKNNYERKTYPDNARYIVKDDFPYEKFPPDFPEPTIIPSKSKRISQVTTTSTNIGLPTLLQTSYKCDLCNISFKSENELSNHLSLEHG